MFNFYNFMVRGGAGDNDSINNFEGHDLNLTSIKLLQIMV